MTAGPRQWRQAVADFDDRTKLELAQIGVATTTLPIFLAKGRLAAFFRLAGAGPDVEIQPIRRSLIPDEHRALLKHGPCRGRVRDLKAETRADPSR